MTPQAKWSAPLGASEPIRSAAIFLILCLITGCGAGEPESTDATDEATSGAVSTGEVRSVDGVAIHFEVRGVGDPAIVLVHGWTNSRGIWGVHPRTLSLNNRVVALDLAGHGESGADRAEWTVDAFGEDVVAVVEELGLGQVVLVGFSMGGGVVLEAAERLGGRVAGIVFVDTFKNVEHRLSDEQAEQMFASFRANWGDTAFVRAFAFTPDAPDSLVKYAMEMMPPQPREHWFTIADAYRDWMQNELASTLHRIDAPIAAINTTEPPTDVAAMQRYAPSFTVDTIGGVGHAGILLRRVEVFDSRLLAVVDRFAPDKD